VGAWAGLSQQLLLRRPSGASLPARRRLPPLGAPPRGAATTGQTRDMPALMPASRRATGSLVSGHAAFCRCLAARLRLEWTRGGWADDGEISQARDGVWVSKVAQFSNFFSFHRR